MEQNLRDALTHLGIALAVFAIWNTGIFTGWKFWVITIGMYAFLLASILEVIFPKFLGK